MDEFKKGSLHSGSKHGPVVTNRKQAIAIGLNDKRKAAAAVGRKMRPPMGRKSGR